MIYAYFCLVAYLSNKHAKPVQVTLSIFLIFWCYAVLAEYIEAEQNSKKLVAFCQTVSGINPSFFGWNRLSGGDAI